MRDRLCTVTPPPQHADQYPSLQIVWEREGQGYRGQATTWVDGNTRRCVHEVYVGEGSPIGSIIIMVDALSHGSWAMDEFSGVDLCERDLQWATLYARQAIDRKHRAFPEEDGRLPECKIRAEATQQASQLEPGVRNDA